MNVIDVDNRVGPKLAYNTRSGCEWLTVGVSSMVCSPMCVDGDAQALFDKPIDVFISYRRSTGSQLAR